MRGQSRIAGRPRRAIVSTRRRYSGTEAKARGHLAATQRRSPASKTKLTTAGFVFGAIGVGVVVVGLAAYT